jgi:Tol biopolymer transport system component
MIRVATLILFVFLLFSVNVFGQIVEIDSVKTIILKGSDELFPAWSKNGTLLTFQSNKTGNWDIMLYDFDKDTLIVLTKTNADEQHPVFVPKSDEIAFDSQIEDKVYIFKINYKSLKKSYIFNRKIFCKEPSFSPNGNIMTFKGYDINSESWQIFSYDFIYDNLNKLTSLNKKEVFSPIFSPDGNIILFGVKEKTAPYYEYLEEINWYGEKLDSIGAVSSRDFCWTPSGFRIICSHNETLKINQLVSERKDGSFKYVLTSDKYYKSSPAISTDGKKLAVAIKKNNEYDIVIFNIIKE